MNLKKNLTCCATSPICHFVALCVGFLAIIQLVHTHAHFRMDKDVDSYCTAFIKKNSSFLNKFDDEY